VPPLRAQVLQDGIDLTLGDRNRSYGDPLENFSITAELKRAFWRGMGRSGKKVAQNSEFGHSIDMVLTNLARIASSPSTHLETDRFVDGANYMAIAYEVGVRTTPNAAEADMGAGSAGKD
jgi:hypothetical protein